MMHIFLLSMLMFSTFMRADTLGEYTQLVDRVYEIVRDVRQAVPAHKWPARFDEICRCMQKDIVPCSSLRYLVEQCRTLACCPEHKLDHLKKPIEDCWQMLASMPYDVPQLSAQELETYRSCCKRYKCLFVSGSLSVGGTATINNLDVTGIAHFFNIPVGTIASYAYLAGEPVADQQLAQSQPVVFNLNTTSKIVNSPDITAHMINANQADGVVAPAGVYVFSWQVAALQPNNSQVQFQLTGNGNALPFTEHIIIPSGTGGIYDVGGVGIITLTEQTIVRIVNTNSQTTEVVSDQATTASLMLLRIKS